MKESAVDITSRYKNGERDFRGASLRGANLEEVNLGGALLVRANLVGANLVRANLRGANLEEVNLRGANLREADLGGALLVRANLVRANLVRANLIRANLIGANLRGANLRGTRYSPLLLLCSISIGEISDSLTAELMKWDAEFRVFGGPSFALWARGSGDCPFDDHEERAFHFNELREAFEYGPPRMSLPELFRAVMEELDITIE